MTIDRSALPKVRTEDAMRLTAKEWKHYSRIVLAAAHLVDHPRDRNALRHLRVTVEDGREALAPKLRAQLGGPKGAAPNSAEKGAPST